MSKKTKIIALIGIFVASVMVIWFYQRPITTVIAQIQTPTLTFEVSTHQNDYLLREPIPFNLKLSNQTNIPIKRGTRLALSDTNFIVRNENGETAQWRMSRFYMSEAIYGLAELPPGGKMESDALLDGRMAEKIFPHPGRYEIQVEYIYDRDMPQQQPIKFKSNSIAINIREPQGIDRQAYNFLKATHDPILTSSDITSLKQTKQNFVDRFPNSVYAKYMIVELAHIYEGSEDSKAIRELCKIHTLDFYYTKDVKKRLLEINARLHPITLASNLPEDVPIPITIIHPCTGLPVDPHTF